MELRQLEFFLEVCERGSFNRAAESLYTTQPNVSKAIHSLEEELGRPLFERSPKGISITPYGRTVKEYAQNVMKNVKLLNAISSKRHGKSFAISSYPSNMIARLLTDFYTETDAKYIIEHMEGSVEQISDNVAQGISELGIVYIADRQLRAFQHVLSHKHLCFQPLAVKEACIYVGKKSPYFDRDSIDFEELSNLRFIRGIQDFFSMEHHMHRVSFGAVDTEQLNFVVNSNSDHLMLDMLMHTDVCSLGIDFMCSKYEQYDIKTLKINHCEPFLAIGYIYPEDTQLSEAGQWLIQKLTQML